MNKSKLELAKELQQIEYRKERFTELLKALTSPYFGSGSVQLQLETKDFKHSGTDEHLQFNPELMEIYIKAEVERHTQRSDEIIDLLANR